MKIHADLDYVREVMGAGGSDVKKCYQCATCSVACQLSPDGSPYPRKEMIWAQWGLKEKLQGDPDVWLCHQCNDCNTQCPRGAKPADVLAAIRRLSVEDYAFPRFMGKLTNKPAMFPILLAGPALLIFVVLAALGKLNTPPGVVEYAKMFPHAILNSFFTLFFMMAAVFLFLGLKKFWADMTRHSGAGGGVQKTSLLPALISVIGEISSHSRFRKCGEDRYRNLAHLGIVYGFVGLLLVTAAAIVYIVLHLEYPLPQSNPFKILGNLSAAALLIGLLMAIFKRLGGRGGEARNSYFDWFLLGVLLVIVVTGILNEILRLANFASLAYPMYFVHLVFVFSFFIYTPYSKMAHFVYRTAAMVHARVTGREQA